MPVAWLSPRPRRDRRGRYRKSRSGARGFAKSRASSSCSAKITGHEVSAAGDPNRLGSHGPGGFRFDI